MNRESAGMASLHFDSRDVAQVEEYVSKIYSKMRIGAVGDFTRAQITRRVLGPDIEFDDLDYSFDIAYNAEPPERLIICDVISNTIRRDGDGSAPEDTFGPGDQFLISRPGLPYGGLAHSTRLRFTLLDPAIFARVATADDDAPAGPVRVLTHRPVSRQAQLRLQHCIAYVRDSLLAATEVSQAPLLVSSASQYLAANVLHTYPNTAVAHPSTRDRSDASPPALARAMAFIETNPDQMLSLTDIAHAAYVTPRALQLAFRRHLDTTPMAYLRRVRLDHAHEELRSCEAGSATVSTVAARWGFTHSRFTQQYQAAYGESPSHTLRR